MLDFENLRYIGLALFLFIVFFILFLIYYSNIKRKTNFIFAQVFLLRGLLDFVQLEIKYCIQNISSHPRGQEEHHF